jgi:predicted nucleic acid-binding protein
VELAGLAWVAAAVATLGGLLAAALAARRTLRRPVLEEWRRSGLRMNSRGWVADAVLATAAVAGLLELYLSGQVNSAKPGTLILLVPGLLGLTVAVIASRLLPAGCRAAYARTGRGGNLGTFLAIRHVARRPSGVRATMVLIAAIALTTFAVSAWSVGDRNQQRVAATEVGAPTVLTVNVPAGKDLSTLVAQADPSGHQAAAVDNYTSATSGSNGLTVLAVDPQRFAQVATWTAAPGQPSLSALAPKLAPRAPAPVVLSGSAMRVTVQVGSVSPAGSTLSADVTTGSSPVSLGTLPAKGTVTLTASLTGCPCVLQDLDLGAPPVGLGNAVPVVGSMTITALQEDQGGHWVAAGGSQALTDASAWRPGQNDAPPDQIRAVSGGLAWKFSTRPAQDALLTSVNRPYPLPAIVSSALLSGGQTQATGAGLDGKSLGLRVIAGAAAVPGAPANGEIVDRNYAELAAGMIFSPNVSEQVWLAGDAQHTIEARLQAAGVSIVSSATIDGQAATYARQGPALSSVLFLADAAAATLLAAGAAILDLYLSARRRRYEYAALSASGVPFRTLRRAVRTELALLLGFGIVVGVVIGGIAAVVTLRSVPEFLTAPPNGLLSYVPPVLPLVVMLVAAVAILTAAAAVASSTLIRGVSLDQLRETPT